MYRVEALPTARIGCDERMLFRGGDIEKRRMINCFAYLLTDGKRKIMIDTGVLDLDAVNRTKKGADRWRREEDDADAAGHLARRGIDPAEITDLVLSHGHYDHAGAAALFSNAHVYLTAKEWDAIFAETNPMAGELGALREYLSERREAGCVTLTEGECALENGLTVIEMPGHTAGSQMVIAETEAGRALFTGDAVFMLANIEESLPIGFSVDGEGSVRALEYCARFEGLLLTGHDPRCADMIKER